MVAIVALASRPVAVAPEPFRVRCRRRPGRKPCSGFIEADLDPDTEYIEWWCPVCGDNGRISNWQGSMWDFRDAEDIQ